MCSVTQPHLTLCKPKNCSPPGSSVHGILQAWILVRVAISFSRGSWSRDRTCISHICWQFFTTQPPGNPNPDSCQRAIDFLSGCHCLLFSPMIPTQGDLWKQLEIKIHHAKISPTFLLQFKMYMDPNSLICFISRKTARSDLSWWVPRLFPFGFLLASKTANSVPMACCPGFQIPGTLTIQQSSGSQHSGYTLYPCSAFWPLPNQPY